MAEQLSFGFVAAEKSLIGKIIHSRSGVSSEILDFLIQTMRKCPPKRLVVLEQLKSRIRTKQTEFLAGRLQLLAS